MLPVRLETVTERNGTERGKVALCNILGKQMFSVNVPCVISAVREQDI